MKRQLAIHQSKVAQDQLLYHSDRGLLYLSIRYAERLAKAMIELFIGSDSLFEILLLSARMTAYWLGVIATTTQPSVQVIAHQNVNATELRKQAHIRPGSKVSTQILERFIARLEGGRPNTRLRFGSCSAKIQRPIKLAKIARVVIVKCFLRRMESEIIRLVLVSLFAQFSFQITFSDLIFGDVSGGEFRKNQAGCAGTSQKQDKIATTYDP